MNILLVKHYIHAGKTFFKSYFKFVKINRLILKTIIHLKNELTIFFLNSSLNQLISRKNIHFILDSVKRRHQSAV